MNTNRLESIVKGACARATLDFHTELNERFDKTTDEIWAHGRLKALEQSLPTLVCNSLMFALADILDDIHKDD